MKKPRMCYTVLESQRDEHGFIPSVVFEGQAGHNPMAGRDALATPWYWGKSWAEARKTCADFNRKLGLNEADVLAIELSSMAN